MARAKNEVRDFRSKVISAPEAALFLGLPERTFRHLVEEGVIPKADRGEYILGDVAKAYWKHRLCGKSLEMEQIRLTKARADRLELDLAEQRGEIHRASAIMRVWANNVINTKTRLLSIPTKAAPELVGKSIQEIQSNLEEEIGDALMELTDYDEQQIARAAASLRK